ncbi:AraC family transcriptional regulator [Brevundimonas sp.]|uniref:AraC family transcriptional regulator n=1 Tax=Brevundimonas sp. TaxID=1871086 RepID=UPI0026399083|nr:AraC family transcriptional regulator [Brevundimonas sp.]
MTTLNSASCVRFDVLQGRLSTASRTAIGVGGGVVLSEISDGIAPVGAKSALSIKYVGRGVEIYRYGGRTYAVREGHFLIVPECLAGEVEVRRGGDHTLGLCVNLPAIVNAKRPLEMDGPMLFGASLSTLGRELESTLRGIYEGSVAPDRLADRLFMGILDSVDGCLEDATAALDRMQSLKVSTRQEMLSRLNRARAYLHDVVDRPVSLGELASAAGMSRFHLLRNFRDCFGAPPATYHRRVRLEHARHAIVHGRMTCSMAAVTFGFSTSASFSRAYKAAFGHPPIRSARS